MRRNRNGKTNERFPLPLRQHVFSLSFQLERRETRPIITQEPRATTQERVSQIFTRWRRRINWRGCNWCLRVRSIRRSFLFSFCPDRQIEIDEKKKKRIKKKSSTRRKTKNLDLFLFSNVHLHRHKKKNCFICRDLVRRRVQLTIRPRRAPLWRITETPRTSTRTRGEEKRVSYRIQLLFSIVRKKDDQTKDFLVFTDQIEDPEEMAGQHRNAFLPENRHFIRPGLRIGRVLMN